MCKEFLTSKEVAEFFGVSAGTISAWKRKEIITPDAKTPGGIPLYSRKQVEDLKVKCYGN